MEPKSNFPLIFLRFCSTIKEARYFVQELEEKGIKCYLNKEKTPDSRYPVRIGRIEIWVDEQFFQQAQDILNDLTAYDPSLNSIIENIDDNSEEFIELRKKAEKRERTAKWIYFWFIVGLLTMMIISLIIGTSKH